MNDRGTEKPTGERQPPRQVAKMKGEGIDATTVSRLVRELRATIHTALVRLDSEPRTPPEVKPRPYRRRNAETVWSLRQAR